MTTRLGRGLGDGAGSKLVFYQDTVIKTAPREEPEYMRGHSGVFVPVLWIDEAALTSNGHITRYAMPFYKAPNVSDREEGLTAGLERLRTLWRIEYIKPALWNWRTQLRFHLRQQILKYRLNVDGLRLEEVIDALPEVERHACIHGDATFANLVWNEVTGDWLWIDPLQRNYIPGDPHVDLGKMFQSCFEYEEALLGLVNEPRFDASLSTLLAQQAHLDWHIGRLWCYIHIVRLLPYQDARVRLMYEQALEGFIP